MLASCVQKLTYEVPSPMLQQRLDGRLVIALVLPKASFANGEQPVFARGVAVKLLQFALRQTPLLFLTSLLKLLSRGAIGEYAARAGFFALFQRLIEFWSTEQEGLIVAAMQLQQR